MVTRPCLACGTPGTRGRCDNCGGRRTTARGYGADHQRRVAALRTQANPCALCGQPIDYTLRSPHPGSFSAHHTTDDKRGPIVASHRLCNEQAGQPPGF